MAHQVLNILTKNVITESEHEYLYEFTDTRWWFRIEKFLGKFVHCEFCKNHYRVILIEDHLYNVHPERLKNFVYNKKKRKIIRIKRTKKVNSYDLSEDNEETTNSIPFGAVDVEVVQEAINRERGLLSYG